MGQGASVASIQWTEDSWNEAMKHESLGDTLSSSTSPLSDVAENLKRLDKLFLAQVANNNDATIEDILHAIELVISFAKENQDDMRSGILLCRSLHSLCILGTGSKHRKMCQKKILKEGGLLMIIEFMNHNINSPLVHRHALSALATITCRNLSVQRASIDLNTIESICSSMKLATMNADDTGSGELAVIVERGCLTFTSLIGGNNEGKIALLKRKGNNNNNSGNGSSNALLSIVNAMEAFTPAPAVQLSGCICLATLSRGIDVKHKEYIALNGGLKCIISAMNFHSGVASVQREAMKALANLISHSAEAKEFAASQGCIDCVLDCLDAFMGAGQVVEPSLFAISNFCCGPSSNNIDKSTSSMNNLSTSSAVGDKNNTTIGIKSSSALKQHDVLDHPPIAPHILTALTSAKKASITRRSLIMNNGGVNLILGAMRVHVRENESIAHAGCCALGALGGGNNNDNIVSNNGGVGFGTTSTSMPNTSMKSPLKSPKSPTKSPKGSPNHQQFFFGHLSPNDINSPNTIRPMTPEGNSFHRINSLSDNFINNISNNNRSNDLNNNNNSSSFMIKTTGSEINAHVIREEIRKEGGLRAVVDAMMFHPTSMQVQLHGCLALAVLWRYPPNTSTMNKSSSLLKNQTSPLTRRNSKSIKQPEEVTVDTSIEDRINDVIPDAVQVVIQALKSTTRNKYFKKNSPSNNNGGGGNGGMAEITANIPLAQAACLAVNTLSKANGYCRYLLAKNNVVELLIATLRVFALSVGKIPRSKLLLNNETSSSVNETFKEEEGNIIEKERNASMNLGNSGIVLDEMDEPNSATPSIVPSITSPPNKSTSGSIYTVLSSSVACAVLEAIGSLSLLGCNDTRLNQTSSLLQSSYMNKSASMFNIEISEDIDQNMNNEIVAQDQDEEDEKEEEEVYLVSRVQSCVPLVVATMRAHITKVDIQRAGCLSLEGLAYESSHYSMKNKTINNTIDNGTKSKNGMTNNNNNNTSGRLMTSGNQTTKWNNGNKMAATLMQNVDIYDVITRAGGLDVIGEARRHHPTDNVISRVAQDATNKAGKWKYCIVPNL